MSRVLEPDPNHPQKILDKDTVRINRWKDTRYKLKASRNSSLRLDVMQHRIVLDFTALGRARQIGLSASPLLVRLSSATVAC